MSFTSNKLTYWNYRCLPLFGSCLFFFFTIQVILNNEVNGKVLVACFVYVVISVAFLLVFNRLGHYIVEVEITDQFVTILNNTVNVDWQEVSSLEFKCFGLYKMKTKNHGVYFFAPSGWSIFFAKYRMFEDEFDKLIARKKRELGI